MTGWEVTQVGIDRVGNQNGLESNALHCVEDILVFPYPTIFRPLPLPSKVANKFAHKIQNILERMQ